MTVYVPPPGGKPDDSGSEFLAGYKPGPEKEGEPVYRLKSQRLWRTWTGRIFFVILAVVMLSRVWMRMRF